MFTTQLKNNPDIYGREKVEAQQLIYFLKPIITMDFLKTENFIT